MAVDNNKPLDVPAEGAEDYNVYLTDLIDVSTLQMIQDAFADMTGMAALIWDNEGKPVTKCSNFTEFCSSFVRSSKKGAESCEECDRHGAESALSSGKSVAYTCHAGLMEYASPIFLNGYRVGSFIGGQVMTEEPVEQDVKKLAEELELDPNGLYEAALQVGIYARDHVEKSVRFLDEIVGFLSEMAYGSYLAKKASEDIKRASAMKTDFLANMSHEIRTPMNAVIGMAEMALREELDETAKEYIEQIRNSGTALLAIINDILDYSKIESGKMEIITEKYDTLSLVNDMTNLVYDQIGSDVEVVLDVMPDVPAKLVGDDLRIKQILTNISSNAVKFTQKGQIKIGVHYNRITSNDVMMEYSVTDTGVGIKEEDIKSLFTSFQQLDSKRNRNSEGTGLGLAIANNLASMMGGGLEVESIYGEGSVFKLVIPQKTEDAQPRLVIKNAEEIRAYGLFGNGYVARQFMADGEYLGVRHRIVVDKYELLEVPIDSNTFFFIDKKYLDEELESYAREHPEFTTVVVLDHDMPDYEPKLPTTVTMRKPLYSVNIAHVYNRDMDSVKEVRGKVQGEFDFVIPDARILVVDDNAINITVAEGLIEPLHANIDRALSGAEAIEKIRENGRYDMVLMDHLMPGMDGVETTRTIRSRFPELADMPIIALTANAFSEVRDVFNECGMNDYIAKPLEVRVLMQKLKQYLPEEMIKRDEFVAEETGAKKKTRRMKNSLLIGDLDVTKAIGLLGTEELFFKVLKDYYNAIEKKAAAIKDFYEAQDWPSYTIEVHALKSASRQIGAEELADMAMELEKAGHDSDIKKIQTGTGDMLEKYLSYAPVLAPYFADDNTEKADKEQISPEILKDLTGRIGAALDELDTDTAEQLIGELSAYSLGEKGEQLLAQLREASENFDMDGASAAINELGSLEI
ncbi:MAG: PocR ligand-binding domain-containing protein [Lachnospiraceae bacterium]|nr:PocR ligand-binding domain-containing protein [Lachnospiraceae bacterium]